MCVTLRSNLLMETKSSETYVNADLVCTCMPLFVCVLASAEEESDEENEQLK